MAINATTLSAAVGLTDTAVALASITGVTAPNYQTGAGITYLFCEQEIMKVSGTPSLAATPVIRGELGTVVSAHGASAPVIAGLPTDFASFAPSIKATVPSLPLDFVGWSAPVAIASNTVVASGPFFHLTGTTIVKNITAPPGYQEGGEVNISFDGSGAGLTWDATGNIAVASAGVAALSLVTFVFDNGSGKWHPSRTA